MRCYVAERIENKLQKQSHSEFAIKAEKLPFAFSEEFSSCYRTAVKHKAHTEGNNIRCGEGERQRTSRKSPSHEGYMLTSIQTFDFKGFNCKIQTST